MKSKQKQTAKDVGQLIRAFNLVLTISRSAICEHVQERVLKN